MNKNNKRLVVESIFIKEALKRKLSLEEFLLLLYFDNAQDDTLDVQALSKALNMNEKTIIQVISSLMEKKIIQIEAGTNSAGKTVEKLNLDNFYNGIVADAKAAEKKSTEKDIFTIFESEFGRTLSEMDYEIIKAWLDKGYTEELILGALKEAVYNGVTSLRYIDKVLFEWQKKGFKTMKDVSNHLKNKNNDSTLYSTKVLNYNWLEDNE
jgi:DNA replication protein